MEFFRGPLRFAALALFVAAACAVGFFVWKRSTRSWLDAHSDRRSSPRIHSGQLKNGLRYAVLPNTQSPGHVSLRLLVEAGSLHERDAEIGYAHFVEHMAFNGTRNFPAGELIRFLQLGGAQFGAHVNAYTAHTHTVYQLDLSKKTPSTVGTGLAIFRDFADGLRFEPFEVERERGVIHSEELSRRYTRRGLPSARELAIFSGTLVSQRPPIGTPGSVDHASSSALRAFYEAWYRPERMILVLVGDVGPAADVEKSIHTHFASLAARAPARPTPDFGKLTARPDLDVAVHAGTRRDLRVELGTIRPETPPPDKAAHRRAQLRLEVAHQMIDRRIRRSLSDDQAASKISATVGEERAFEAFRRNAVTVTGSVERLDDIVSTCERPLRAALEHGFHPTELPPIQQARLSRHSRSASAAPRNPALAAQIVASALGRRACVFADETQAEDRENVETLTVEACHAALREAWANQPRLLFASVPEKDAPSAEKFSAALAASAKRSAAKPQPVENASDPLVAFPYRDFGAPGKIRFENRVPDLDVRQICFSNGVRLNLKRTDFENQRVHLRLQLGLGRLDEPLEHPGLGLWFLGMGRTELGRIENTALRRLLSDQGITQGFGSGHDAFSMTLSSPPDSLPLALQILTARLTDTVFPPAAETAIRAQLERMHQFLAAPIDHWLSGNDSRFGPANRSAFSKQTLVDFEKWIRAALQSSPLELTIVGDFDSEAAINDVALTLGTLPLRALSDDRPELHRLRPPRPP